MQRNVLVHFSCDDFVVFFHFLDHRYANYGWNDSTLHHLIVSLLDDMPIVGTEHGFNDAVAHLVQSAQFLLLVLASTEDNKRFIVFLLLMLNPLRAQLFVEEVAHL